MRRIVLHLMISLDGYFEGPDADIGWHRVDEELHTSSTSCWPRAAPSSRAGSPTS